MLEDYSKAYALKYIALRYFNACGADPEGDIGEDHDPETHLIPLVLQTCAGKRDNIKKDLGWNPEYTDISKIIQTAWNWHKNR